MTKMKTPALSTVVRALAILAASISSCDAQTRRFPAGDTVQYMNPPSIFDTITPYTGVKSDDLVPPANNGTYLLPVNLGNYRGYVLVPPEAYSFTIWGHLFRSIAGSVGQTDLTISPNIEGDTPMNLATLACTPIGSGNKCVSSGSIVESIGLPVPLPNVVDANGNNAVVGLTMGGNTILGGAAWIRLSSFTVPPSYVLPSVWPAKNVSNSMLSLYFGADGFSDSSSSSRTVTAVNSSIQPDGGANFNGLNTLLSFDGGSTVLSGDFKITVTMAGLSNALQGGSQQRLVSYGGPGSPAIGIDQVGGGAILLNEQVAILKTCGNSLVSGYRTTIEWRRVSGVNTCTVNDQQDGPTFNDNTAWVISSSSEIGRLNGHPGLGQFTGEIYNIRILNGIGF